jgi:hypothetical protein
MGAGEAILAGGEVSSGGRRDSTALTVVEVDLERPGAAGLDAPTYRAVHRRAWVGAPHHQLYQAIAALVEHWQAQTVVIDATGVGAGLASFLSRLLGPGRLVPFRFSALSKSDLGWQFLGIIETGRYREFQPGLAGLPDQDELQRVFWEQARACQCQVLPGPGRLLRWGVPPGARSAVDNTLLHDDLLVSAALCAALDRQTWGLGKSAVIPAPDIFAGMPPAY